MNKKMSILIILLFSVAILFIPFPVYNRIEPLETLKEGESILGRVSFTGSMNIVMGTSKRKDSLIYQTLLSKAAEDYAGHIDIRNMNYRETFSLFNLYVFEAAGDVVRIEK